MCKKLCFFIPVLALLGMANSASAVVVDGYQEWTERTQLANLGGLEITSTGHAKFTARVDHDAVDVTIAAGGILETLDTYKLPDEHPEPTRSNVYVNGTWNANNIESKGTGRAAYIYVGATGVINIQIGYGGTAPYENPADYDPLTWLADNSLLVDPSLDPAVWFIQITDMGGGAAQITAEALAVQVGFDSEASADLESVSPALLTVSLSESQTEAVTVDYSVTGGTATRNVDYTLADGTLTFSPGQTTKTISINIVNDGLDENDETIVVTLSNPTGPDAVLGEIPQHTYTIVDPRPAVAFDTVDSSSPENIYIIYLPRKIAVSLSYAAASPVTVDYAVTGGTAIGGGVDYSLSDGPLSFAPGELTRYIEVTPVDDDLEEANETILLTLSNPSGAKLGASTEHRFTILDDDTGAQPPNKDLNNDGTVDFDDVAILLSHWLECTLNPAELCSQ